MTIPSRFSIEYPSRALQLIDALDAEARNQDLIGSLGLLAAAALLTIPYERMKASHFLHDGERTPGLADEIRRLQKVEFLSAPFWNGKVPGEWRQSRIMAFVENVDAWKDEKGRRSVTAAANTINCRPADDVIRVLRNALAHGNIIYLDGDYREIAGNRMAHMAFLSRYEENEDQREKATTYRVVMTSEGEFLRFVKSWAAWVSGFPLDASV